jgi:hypothetical protein
LSDVSGRGARVVPGATDGNDSAGGGRQRPEARGYSQ